MGSISNFFPFDSVRDSSDPVSTVPCPGTAKQWFTARRNPPRASRSGTYQWVRSTSMRCAMPYTLWPGPTATGRTGTVASLSATLFAATKVCVSRVTASIAAVLSASIGDNRSVSFSAALTVRLRHEPHSQQTLERLDLEPFAAGSQVPPTRTTVSMMATPPKLD